MAERFVSPGVFTTENDLSFLPQGIAEIGGAFIGPCEKGPAFRPVNIATQTDFEATFGTPTPNSYLGYTVQDYLRNGRNATVVRVLGLGGYSSSLAQSWILYVSASVTGSGGLSTGVYASPFAVIHPTTEGVSLISVSATGTDTSFTLQVSGSGTLSPDSVADASIYPTDNEYLVNLLGESPNGTKNAYVYSLFPNVVEQISDQAFTAEGISGTLFGASIVAVSAGTTAGGNFDFVGQDYSSAYTPYIRSQTLGAQRYDLFRFHTLADGNSANRNVKVSILNVKGPGVLQDYGTFSLVVRDFNDTDNRLSVLEQFDNLTLDPNSPNYIARRIGDSQPRLDPNTGDFYFDGDYPNLSKYIWVEMSAEVLSGEVPALALPYGFGYYDAPINLNNVAPVGYVTTRYLNGVANNRIHYGFDFGYAPEVGTQSTLATEQTNLSYLSPIPEAALGNGSAIVGATEFNFEDLAAVDEADVSSLTLPSAVNARKFTVAFQGGFDGMNPAVKKATGADITATNSQGFDLSVSTAMGSQAYARALRVVANPDSIDINLLVMPGVINSLHPYVASLGIELCENRGDCFYVMDGSSFDADVDDAIVDVSGTDTNYAAVYYPWVKIRDVNANKNLWVPPSVVIPSIYAFNDRVSAEWFAPAGLNRGGISSAIQIRRRLSQGDRDALYDGRVNPIATFPGNGIVVFGQKTLQARPSALDRINVRRLLIAVKKFIASSSRFLVFEQNVDATRQRFLNIVNPYLSSVQERSGLFAFRVVMDETNNTPDIIDRNVLVGQIYLQPTRTAEFISLEFNILPTGATFGAGA